ncbi:MAG TPA: hypothetical protein DCY94_00955 [Firmicutes bacterium]|nr:hypothetical protein [Bacillota bacterium]
MNDPNLSNYFASFSNETLIKIHDFIVAKNYQAYTVFFISNRHMLSDYFASFPVEQFKNPSFWEDEACVSIFEDLPNEFSKLLEKIQRSMVQESIKYFRALKDYLQLPLTCDIEELDFKSFYTPKPAGFSSVRDFGASIIAPDTSLHAISKDERIIAHEPLFKIMIKNLYDIEGENFYDVELQRNTEEILSTYRSSFVLIRHISNTNNLFATVDIPTYVTPFQFEELKRLNSVFKQLNVKVHTIYVASPLLSNGFPTLEQVLEYIEINGRIRENAIPLKKRVDALTQNQI